MAQTPLSAIVTESNAESAKSRWRLSGFDVQCLIFHCFFPLPLHTPHSRGAKATSRMIEERALRGNFACRFNDLTRRRPIKFDNTQSTDYTKAGGRGKEVDVVRG